MTTRSTCRSCGSHLLSPVLSLGRMPLANALLAASDLERRPEPTFPLDVVFCEICTLIQITEEVPPETMFSSYVYLSSYSDTMVREAHKLVQEVIRTERLGPRSLALEIASNDGYLLSTYVAAGVPVLGIEPAKNITAIAIDRGVRTIGSFFGTELADTLYASGVRADVVHANNVLAHVPDLNGFMSGIARVLSDSGVAIIEVPYVRDLVERCEFDTIYHEHLCYFSLGALKRVATSNGLVIHDAVRIPIHGGSLRVSLSKPGTRQGFSAVERFVAVDVLLDAEEASGMDSLPFYADLSRRAAALRSNLVREIGSLRSAGHAIAAYGAAAKGATLLNYAGLNADMIDFVVDRSPHKQGSFMPGSRVPILAPEALLERQPDYCLLLAWNFADEILEQQAAYRARGGRFIIPVPELRIV